MFNLLSGKKTYIVLALFVVAVLLWAFNVVEIPEQIWAILVALGFGAVRSALRAIQPNTGYKTYIAVVGAVVISAAQMLGLSVPAEIITLIYTVTGSLGVVGIRDAVNKLQE